MKRILFSIVCISLMSAGCADKSVSDKNAQLIQAAKDGSLPAVQTLLAGGADVNARRTKEGVTALWMAAQDGRTEIAKSLIEKGSDINAKAGTGQTSLWIAAHNGHTETVKFLLETGAE